MAIGRQRGPPAVLFPYRSLRAGPVRLSGCPPRGARELRQRCDAMPPSVLYQRLAELTEAQLISQDAGNRYRLIPVGQALATAIAPLDQWAKASARHTAVSPKQP